MPCNLARQEDLRTPRGRLVQCRTFATAGLPRSVREAAEFRLPSRVSPRETVSRPPVGGEPDLRERQWSVRNTAVLARSQG
jgi:hypothetical protein